MRKNKKVLHIYVRLFVSPTEEVSNFFLDDFEIIVGFMNAQIK